MMRLISTAALSLALCGQAVAAPKALTSAPAKAELVLRAVDIHLTPDVITRAGVTEQMAKALLEAPEAGPYDRVRAVSALAFFQTDTAYDLLAAQARSASEHQVRVQAVISLARAFGPADPQKVDATLAALPADARLARVIAEERARLARPSQPGGALR